MDHMSHPRPVIGKEIAVINFSQSCVIPWGWALVSWAWMLCSVSKEEGCRKRHLCLLWGTIWTILGEDWWCGWGCPGWRWLWLFRIGTWQEVVRGGGREEGFELRRGGYGCEGEAGNRASGLGRKRRLSVWTWDLSECWPQIEAERPKEELVLKDR